MAQARFDKNPESWGKIPARPLIIPFGHDLVSSYPQTSPLLFGRIYRIASFYIKIFNFKYYLLVAWTNFLGKYPLKVFRPLRINILIGFPGKYSSHKFTIFKNSYPSACGKNLFKSMRNKIMVFHFL